MNQQHIIQQSWLAPAPFIQLGRRRPLLVFPTWSAEIRIGHYFGEFGSYAPTAGVAFGQRRIQIYNSGTDTCSGAVARLINRVKRFKKTGEVFARVRPFAEDATELLTGDQVARYVLTASSVSGSGASKTMTLAGASMTSVKNLSTQVVGGLTVLNVVDYYRVQDGALESMEFKLSQAAVNSDFENVLVFSPRFLQIAEDVGGAPGTWGTTDVSLTESGQSSGQISAAGVAYLWARILVPDGGNSESNPYILDVALEASASSSAGWVS